MPDLNQFYFDESIHPRGGFILGAYVYGPSADASVARALEICGLRPDIDEFKSSARMTNHPEQVALRSELRGILDEYRIGVLVMPAALRTSLGAEALRGLDQFARLNLSTAGRPVAFFDEGIFHSVGSGHRGIGKSKTLPRINADDRGSYRQKSEPQRTQRNTEGSQKLTTDKHRWH